MLSQLLKGGEGGGLSDGEDYLNIIPPQYRALIERFWPGPLTLLFTRPPHVPAIVTAGQPTIAIRFPAHPVARALIERCGFPIAAVKREISEASNTED